MGWAQGSYLANDLYDEIRDSILPENREDVAWTIYTMFCNADADDWYPGSNLIKDGKVAEKDHWYED